MNSPGLFWDVPFLVVVEFASDWITGDGVSGDPVLDAMTYRDSDGFPAMAGSHVRGVMADHMRTITDGLDNNAGADSQVPWGRWQELMMGRRPHRDRSTQDRGPQRGLIDTPGFFVHPELRRRVLKLSATCPDDETPNQVTAAMVRSAMTVS